MTKLTKEDAHFEELLESSMDLINVFLNSHFEDFTESVDLELEIAANLIGQFLSRIKPNSREDILQDIVSDIRSALNAL